MDEEPVDDLQKFINDWINFLSKDGKTIEEDLLARIQRDTIDVGLMGLGHNPDSEFDDKAGVVLEIIASSRKMSDEMRNIFFDSLKDDIDLVLRAGQREWQPGNTTAVNEGEVDIVDLPGVVHTDPIVEPDVEKNYEGDIADDSNTDEVFDEGTEQALKRRGRFNPFKRN